MRARIKHIIILVFMLSSLGGTAQKTVQLTGELINNKSEVLKDIFIEIPASNLSTVTDQNGIFYFDLIPDISYTLIFTSLNYEQKSETISITTDTEIQFLLEEKIIQLPSISIESKNDSFNLRQLRSIENGGLYEGKKSEVINIEKLIGNKATNNARQAFSHVPNLNIWESDNAGLQLDIGGRGLSPKRTTNFNSRQNGYDMSADALGYPESYYNPPLQAVKQIELVRGAAALQYGSQFGGMINFKIKEGNKEKKVNLESINTYGANNFFNTYNSINGQIGKFNYYTYGQYKRGDGWRDNSNFEQIGAYFAGNYAFNSNFKIGVEYTHMNYLSQQAGGLTDEAFLLDPRASNRERNWFKVNWNLFALLMEYKVNEKTKLYSRFFGLASSRSSLGVLETPDLEDPMTFRDLLVGQFRNYGNETRLSYSYKGLANLPNALLVGTRAYSGNTTFSQQFGSDGFDPDFTAIDTSFFERRNSEFNFPNTNLAFFAENIFRITDKFSLIPGFRVEYIDTRSEGFFTNTIKIDAFENFIVETIEDSSEKSRTILLYGIGLSSKFSKQYELYGNATSNYRAINFTDVQIQTNIQVVDPDIVDESGYSFDLGVRKRNSDIFFVETGLYYIIYDNRIGEVIDDGLRLRTNIGSARIFGYELLFELDILEALNKQSNHKLSAFVNGSVNRGVYTEINNRALVGVRSGNRLEDLPIYNAKVGINYAYKSLQLSAQSSWVGQQFSDAANTTSAFKGVFGEIPAYNVLDFSAEYRLNKSWMFSFNLNNALNSLYFTRRAVSYPGPGIIPALGRTWNVSVALNI